MCCVTNPRNDVIGRRDRSGPRWYQLTVTRRLVACTLFQCDSRSMSHHGARGASAGVLWAGHVHIKVRVPCQSFTCPWNHENVPTISRWTFFASPSHPRMTNSFNFAMAQKSGAKAQTFRRLPARRDLFHHASMGTYPGPLQSEKIRAMGAHPRRFLRSGIVKVGRNAEQYRCLSRCNW